MGTKRNPAEFDCYGAAEPDEEMFILLGRDSDGGHTVRGWARRYWWRKIFPLLLRTCLPISNGPFSPPDENYSRRCALLQQRQRKHREALQCALKMDAWWLRKELDKQAAARRYAQRRAVAWFMLPWC